MWQNELADSDLSTLSYVQGKESPRYQTVSETWDSDGYTRYTPSFDSTDAKKHHDRRSLHRSRNDTKATSNNRYYHEQEFSRSVSQSKHWLDEKDLQTKASRSESRSKKERIGEKKKNPKRINPVYVVNAPSCYGYFNYDEVVQQLQGNKKIYKHSTEKKLY